MKAIQSINEMEKAEKDLEGYQEKSIKMLKDSSSKAHDE